jgi:hypothetical protein
MKRLQMSKSSGHKNTSFFNDSCKIKRTNKKYFNECDGNIAIYINSEMCWRKIVSCKLCAFTYLLQHYSIISIIE